jgi:photosystem II stability/assembly factor-like uncharacterized protein
MPFRGMRLRSALFLLICCVVLAACLPPAFRSAATPSPHGVSPSEQILVAHLFTPNAGWVLTTDRVLTTADGGATWADVTPSGTVTTSVHVVAPGSAPSPNARALQAAFFLNPSQAWAVLSGPADYTACGQVPLDLFSSTDGGRHWTSRPMRATTQCDTPGPVYLTFIDAMRGWLIVDQGSNSNFTRYDGFQTTDGGVTWAPVEYPQSAPLVFLNRRDGFSVGGGGYPTSGAYGTHDGGQTWARLTLPQLSFEAPVFTNGGNGVIAGAVTDTAGRTSSLVFYSSSDSGLSWRLASRVTNPEPDGAAQFVGAVNRSVWLAQFLGPGPVNGRTYARLKRTQDGGRTWTWLPASITGAFAGDISFAGTAGLGIVVDAGCRGFKTDCFTNWTLYRTLDAGGHWAQVAVT